MTWRLRQWFTDLGPVDPTQPTSPIRYARYNGQYGGKTDPLGEGIPGDTYVITILSAAKLDAPNPPFQDPETGSDELNKTFQLLPPGTLRQRRWFTILESIDPTDPQSIYRYARYNGIYEGEKDAIGQGEIGKVYPVTLSNLRADSLLEAPNPPFQDPEA